MNTYIARIFILTTFIVLTFVYYFIPDLNLNVDKVFLTLSTFLFTILAGFFVSRQSSRYSDIRRMMADFDGIMSSVYRNSSYFGEDTQKEVGEIIVAHYKPIIESKEWDYSFTHKTSTITNLHNLLKKTVSEKGTDGIKGSVAGNIVSALHSAQLIRKNMVSLREERVPSFQWFLIYVITIVLFMAVSIIPSVGLLTGSVIKSAFIVSVFVVIMMLKKLDKLQLFEGAIGAHSAQDVIDIINNKK